MEKEDLDFLREMLKSMDKKDEHRHNEIIKLTNQTDNNLKMTREFITKDLELTQNIGQEMKTTRVMIDRKYKLFGAMMSSLTSMMAGLLTAFIILPWNLSAEIQTSISLLVILVTLFISFGIWWRLGKATLLESQSQNI